MEEWKVRMRVSTCSLSFISNSFLIPWIHLFLLSSVNRLIVPLHSMHLNDWDGLIVWLWINWGEGARYSYKSPPLLVRFNAQWVSSSKSERAHFPRYAFGDYRFHSSHLFYFRLFTVLRRRRLWMWMWRGLRRRMRKEKEVFRQLFWCLTTDIPQGGWIRRGKSWRRRTFRQIIR